MTARFEDLRQSDEWADYLSHLGWLTVRSKIKNQKSNIFIRKLPLVGSVAKIQRPTVVPAVEEIDEITKKYRALFVKLEPGLGQGQALQLPTVGKHFEPDNWSLSSTRTIHADLSQNEEEIFGKFSKDARYSVRRAERNGVSVCHSDTERSEVEESLANARRAETSSEILRHAQNDSNLKKFYNLLKETGGRKKFWVAPFKDLRAKAEAFKDKSALIFAYHNHQTVAGALILFHDQVAYYHHAASNLQGRKLLAPYLVVWEVIKLAKKRGCHTLDLEGIYDPRYKIYKRFRKIGTFKKKFGGKEIEYPGSFIRYYNPIVKFIFGVSSWY